MSARAIAAVRSYRDSDAADLPRVMYRAVHEIASRYYSQAQCLAWCPKVADPEDFVARLSDGRAVWVLADGNDHAQGFIELMRAGCIDRFYCVPSFAGKGGGRALYTKLEAQARAWSLTSLSVDASEAARGFFQRQGFTVAARQELQRHGVDLHNYLMKKALPIA